MTPASKKKTTMKKAAIQKVTRKKVTKKKAVNTRKASAKKGAKKTSKTAKPDMSSINITPEERWKLIVIAAYHKAVKRRVVSAGELQGLVEVEKEVDGLLS